MRNIDKLSPVISASFNRVLITPKVTWEQKVRDIINSQLADRKLKTVMQPDLGLIKRVDKHFIIQYISL